MQARRLFRRSTCNAASFATMLSDVYLGTLANLRTEHSQRKTVLALFFLVTAWFTVQCDMAIEISKGLDARVLHKQEFQIGKERIQILVALILFLAAVAQIIMSPMAAGVRGTGVQWDAEGRIVPLILIGYRGLRVLGGFIGFCSIIFLFVSNDMLSVRSRPSFLSYTVCSHS